MESGSSLDSVGRYFGYDSYYRFVILERAGKSFILRLHGKGEFFGCKGLIYIKENVPAEKFLSPPEGNFKRVGK